jgi:hypothetical protein
LTQLRAESAGHDEVIWHALPAVVIGGRARSFPSPFTLCSWE